SIWTRSSCSSSACWSGGRLRRSSQAGGRANMALMTEYDVVVVGAGNAAFCAAHAARERAGRVLMLEKAPREWIGGNTYFTAGAFRSTYSGIDELRPLLDIDDAEASRIVLPPYI